ncbi:hypothetical protein PtrV1_03790 [Pyrenophora tritici-repentis]|nr:hypothetical protein PtrV1_03790 [Pyrenophora tritici-repentis]
MPRTTRGKAAQRANAEYTRNSKITASSSLRSIGAPYSTASNCSRPKSRRRTTSLINDNISLFSRSSVKKQYNS